ncbi:MAG: DNA repair protein RecO [Candidatus Latescibacteria bacterium]|nr:DNA repair protein RecO [Candidatus Latescibacterota bacterium]
MGIRSTRAVVTKTMRMSNSSKLVSLITEKYGLVKVMAKGARRPQSKFGASLEPVTLIDTIYYDKGSRDIQTLTSAEIEKSYLNIKDDLKMLSVASCMVEIAQFHTAEEDVSAGTFRLVVESLDDLESGRKKDADKHLWRFMMRLLETTGYRPSLDSCYNCGKKPKGTSVFFSFEDGGVLCSCTSPDNRYGIRVSAGSLMVMQSLLDAKETDLPNLSIGKDQKHEVEKTILQFLAYHSGSSRPPKSLAFMRKLESAI